MEDFILKEVDYSQQYGYSSRAKRYMRRKLNKELAPYVESESDTSENVDSNESENDSNLFYNRHIPQINVDICIAFVYVCCIVSFYGSIIYITQAYRFDENKIC
jgi:hypothetical protein